LPRSRRAVLGAAVFLAAWGLLHVGFWRHGQVVDTPVYAKYGEAISRGDVPYRDFTPEYPPLALAPFVPPALVTADADAYRAWFEVEMAVCGAGVVAVVAAAGGSVALAALFPLALGTVVLTRFDLWPTLLAAAALLALLRGRDRLGAVLLGAGIAAKLWPAVLLPLAVAWAWRRRGRREGLLCGALCVAVVAACYAPFLVLAPDGVAHSLGRQLSRPLQIETLGSGFLLVAHRVAGLQIAWKSEAGSQNLVGTLPDVLAALQSVLQAAALLLVWWRFARGRIDLLRAASAAVVAFVALGKVLSPQFMIWLVPFVALVGGLEALLLAAALAATQVWFPFRYWDLVKQFDPLASWFVLLRDLLLVALLVVLLRPVRDSPASWPARRSRNESRTPLQQSA
jgi:hypothetical protein